MNSGLKKFIKSWLITAFAVLVTALLLNKHVRYGSPGDLLIAAFLLGILNAFIRPLLFLLALPLLISTLGLFMVVINGCLLYLVHGLMGTRFEIDGFGWAMLASILIGLISFPLNLITGNTNNRIVVQRQAQRPPNSRSDDDGPVIDV
jgi:putative membrane protein